MREISSGLVAVRIDTDGYPLVRLSDAEAIIAAKDAEIERLNGECDRLAKAASKNYRDNGLPINEEFYKQSERIKELESEILEQCRINGMGAERELALLGQIERQSAALKLAMEALVTARDTFTRYSLHHEVKGDFEKAQANKAFADSLKKAIAAIDAAPTPPVSEDRWQPIETAPKETTQMFVVVAFGAKVGATPYNSDPWCVWHQRGEFVRWPHKFSPTHWMPLPKAPAMEGK